LKSRRNFGATLKIQHHAAGIAVISGGALSRGLEKLSTLVEIRQESKSVLLLKQCSQN
jgi:hypothetical protein